jgi:hypothetical protein
MSGVGTITETATLPVPSPQGEFLFTSMAGATSMFAVSFQLDTPQLFDVDALFTSTSHASSQVLLEGPGDLRLIDFGAVIDVGAVSSAKLRETRLLPPGMFSLRIQEFVGSTLKTMGTSTHDGEFSFTVDLTPTPEPASLVLLGSGLWGLFGVKRRRSASA